MTPAPKLIELLYANIGKPLTSDLAADICMAAAGRTKRPFPATSEFGNAIYEGIEFRVERMVDVVPEIKVLHANHWRETEGYRDAVGFEPDYGQYVAIDRDGSFMLITARVEAAMVGYFMCVLHTSRHSSKYVAAEDAFYLAPEFRKGWALMTMVRFTLACLRKIDVKQITLSEKLTHLIGPVLKRAGFTHCGNLWTKVL